MICLVGIMNKTCQGCRSAMRRVNSPTSCNSCTTVRRQGRTCTLISLGFRRAFSLRRSVPFPQSFLREIITTHNLPRSLHPLRRRHTSAFCSPKLRVVQCKYTRAAYGFAKSQQPGKNSSHLRGLVFFECQTISEHDLGCCYFLQHRLRWRGRA